MGRQEMDVRAVKEAYSRWAGVYDWVFGALFDEARRKAIAKLDAGAGRRILEVGVGTGLSLEHYPEGSYVVGIDISRAMLDRAAQRWRRRRAPAGWVVEGDAARLPFPSGAFDAGLASYVVSAAPQPVQVMEELQRVCRPGAPVVMLNHFSSSNPVLSAVERGVSGVTSRLLGFHAHFPLQPLVEEAGLHVVDEERVPPMWYWQVVRCVADGAEEGRS